MFAQWLPPIANFQTDSQMTMSFFMLRPVKGREMNHSQMTMGFFMLRPVKGREINHSQMTTGIWVF